MSAAWTAPAWACWCAFFRIRETAAAIFGWPLLRHFLSNLLQLTKLAGIFRVYDSEEEAIVSFLKEPGVPVPGDASVGPMVLFVDQSPDLCAFVRVLLHHHGYEVLSTCRIHDAKMLLAAAKFDYIVLGPDSSHLPSDNVVAVAEIAGTGGRDRAAARRVQVTKIRSGLGSICCE